MTTIATQQEIRNHFPIGKRVRFENEAFANRWQYGTVVGYEMGVRHGYGIAIVADGDANIPSYRIVFGEQFLDVQDERNSYVRSTTH